MIKLLDNKETPQFKYIKELFNSMLNSLSSDNIVFDDDLLRYIIERRNEIDNKFDISYDFIKEEDVVSKDYFNKLLNKLYFISSMNMKSIPDCYSEVSSASNDIIRKSEDLSVIVNNIENEIQQTESVVLNSKVLNSIKDEVIVYEDFTDNINVLETDLFVDIRSGCLVLNNTASKEIKYKISSIMYNKQPGVFNTPVFKSHTDISYNNGYLPGRLFSSNPYIMNKAMENPENIYDNNLETALTVEYNSKTSRETFSSTLNIIPESDVDYISLQCDQGDNDSVESKKGYSLVINNIKKQYHKQVEYLPESLLSNEISIGNSKMGSTRDKLKLCDGEVYPLISNYIQMKDIDILSIDLLNSIPQKINYPEKTVYDKYDKEIYKFNYYETLMLNKYAADKNCINPNNFYSDKEIMEMNEILNNGKYSIDTKNLMYRYLISIRELKMFKYTFKSSGSFISNNLYDGTKLIASVEIYVNEYVPVNSSINYFVSFDKNTWYQITPSNTNSIGIKRIVLTELNSKDNDTVINLNTSTVYIKIDMSGSDKTPVLKSFATRIKLQ